MSAHATKVSDARLAVLAYIDREMQGGKRSPRLIDIAAHFGYATKGSAQDAVHNLRQHGLVEWTDLQRLGLTITRKGRAALAAADQSTLATAAVKGHSVGRPRKPVRVLGLEPLPVAVELPPAFANHRGVKHPPMPQAYECPAGMSRAQWAFGVATSNYVLDVGRLQ